MAQFFYEVVSSGTIFAAYAIITLVALLVLILVLVAIRGAMKDPTGFNEVGCVGIHELCGEYTHATKEAQATILGPKHKKTKDKAKEVPRDNRLFVLDFEGGLKADEVQELRHEISLICLVAQKGDEVLLRLESPGGWATAYFFAADQVKRLQQAGLSVTVSIDLVAASGGYMVAAVGNRIIASSDAIIGSIGVVIEFPNIHTLLKGIGIEYHSFTSGELKRPISPFNEVSQIGRDWAEKEVKECFEKFWKHVRSHRPAVEEHQEIRTGDIWTADQALTKGLVDAIELSDDFLLERFRNNWRILRVKYDKPKSLKEQLAERLAGLLTGAISQLWHGNYYPR